MKIGTRAALIAGLLMTGWAWAGDGGTNQTLRLELDLVDGSCVIGVPKLESVPVQTSYATMDIPLAQITTVVMGDDHETATLDLRNGDKVKGVLSLRPLDMETVFGNVKIGIENIKKIRSLLSGGPLWQGIRDSLVLHYSFDKNEGNRTHDSVNKDSYGDVHRGATWIEQGRVGGAYEFDGSEESYIEFGPSELYQSRGELSACAWVRPVSGRNVIVLSNYRGGSAYAGLFLFYTRRVVVILGQGPGQEVTSASGTEDVVPTDGGWHHVAFSYDERRGKGCKIKLYVDGKEVNGYEAAGVRDSGTGGPVLQIGDRLRTMAGRDSFTRSSGAIDEIMLFKRALSDSEIRQIYDAQK